MHPFVAVLGLGTRVNQMFGPPGPAAPACALPPQESPATPGPERGCSEPGQRERIHRAERHGLELTSGARKQTSVRHVVRHLSGMS